MVNNADFTNPHFGCLLSSFTRLMSGVYVIVGVYDLGVFILTHPLSSWPSRVGLLIAIVIKSNLIPRNLFSKEGSLFRVIYRDGNNKNLLSSVNIEPALLGIVYYAILTGGENMITEAKQPGLISTIFLGLSITNMILVLRLSVSRPISWSTHGQKTDLQQRKSISC